MKDGFPLLTTKKMAFKTMVTELLWFLRGDTNIKYLVDNDCNIWNGDAYKNFKSKTYPISSGLNEFEMEDFILAIKNDQYKEYNLGDLGPIYGKQWRDWSVNPNHTWGIDQIANSINLLKTDPDSRRNRVNAWNVGELDQMVLPPCHTDFQFYTRELSLEERLCIADKFNPLIREDCLTKVSNPNQTPELKLIEQHEWLDSLGPNVVPQRRAISLMYNCRSQDVPLGTPFNISSYALLLEIIAKQVNMVPDQLIGNLGDCHIYLNQIDGVKEQLTREPYPLPTVKISDRVVNDISEYTLDDIILENYQSHPTIKMPLSN
jgi:thymidylate synthase